MSCLESLRPSMFGPGGIHLESTRRVGKWLHPLQVWRGVDLVAAAGLVVAMPRQETTPVE